MAAIIFLLLIIFILYALRINPPKLIGAAGSPLYLYRRGELNATRFAGPASTTPPPAVVPPFGRHPKPVWYKEQNSPISRQTPSVLRGSGR